ncbi:MAG TPA: PEGA domain-containing protein [Verrucomicrobiae bacterium]|nr:PEGA domain-containing protein [Verrucomicrobiae bacterium]
MSPYWRRSWTIGALAAFFAVLTPRAWGDTLRVTTSPAGATVEVDDAEKCVTPCELKYPGNYFHKPHTVFSSRLEHSMKMKLSKPGFRTKELTLTNGPFAWTDLRGRKHGEYYVFKAEAVDVTLDPLPPTESDAGEQVERVGPIRPRYAKSFTREDDETAGGGSVRVESDPEGAEIYIDGNFVGQTPAKFSLAAGVHRLVMKAQGKREWERDLEVMKDSQLTLHPVLDSETVSSH